MLLKDKKQTVVRLGLILFVGCLLIPSFASGATLWEQLADPSQQNFVDQEFGDFPAFSTYMVNDATFTSAVSLSSITTWYTNNNGGAWTGVTTARLNIFNDDGSGLPLGTDDPTGGTTVTVSTIVNGDGLIEMTADIASLALILAAGDYWFGLTPIADFGVFGQEFHQGALGGVVGDQAAARNPGAAFGLGPAWFQAGQTFGGVNFDSAFAITGEDASVPEPGTLFLLSAGLVALATRRRLKKRT